MENKNNWSIDLDLHIPVPSMKITIHKGDDKQDLFSLLRFDKKKEKPAEGKEPETVIVEAEEVLSQPQPETASRQAKSEGAKSDHEPKQ